MYLHTVYILVNVLYSMNKTTQVSSLKATMLKKFSVVTDVIFKGQYAGNFSLSNFVFYFAGGMLITIIGYGSVLVNQFGEGFGI